MPPTTTWSGLTGPASAQTSIATTTYPAVLIAEDSFSNGAAQALITDRSGELATWNKHPSYTSVFRLSSASRAYLPSTNSHGAAFLSENTTGADYRVRARLRWLSDPSDGIYDGGVFVRFSPTADTGLLAWWQTVTTPGLHLYSAVAGAFSELTRIDLAEPTVGTDYDLEVVVQGSRVTATLSGGVSATIAATTSAVTLPGRGGLRAFNLSAGGNAVGLHFDNVYVDTQVSESTSIATTATAIPSWTSRSDASSAWNARSASTASWVPLA